MRQGVRVSVEPVGEQLAHCGRDVFAAACNGADGTHDLFRIAFLVEIPRCTLAQQGGGVMRFGETAEDQHRQVGFAGLDCREEVDAVLIGHRNIKDDDVCILSTHDVECFATIGSFAGDFEIHLFGEKLAKACANDSMVIDYGDTDHLIMLSNVCDFHGV